MFSFSLTAPGFRDVGDDAAILRRGVSVSGPRHAAAGVHGVAAALVAVFLPDVGVEPGVSEIVQQQRLHGLRASRDKPVWLP